MDIEPKTNLFTLREIFMNPDINTKYKIKFNNVDNDKITEFLCEKHGFSEDRVLNTTSKMKELNTAQRSLEDWF